MKKFFFLLTIIMSATILTASASPAEPADPKTERAFQKHFAGAENVRWESVEEGYKKVSFTWGGHRTEAYYSPDGELAGSIRGLFFEQLPLTVVRSVSGAFKDGIVLEVREITNDEGTNYRLIVEENSKKYRLRVNSFGSVIEKQKIRK